MFASGYSLAIHGETFTWASATEDSSLHTDIYANSTGQSVSVTGKISYTALATVSGSDSQGSVDGYLSAGAYYDTQVDTTAESGSWTLYGITYTSRDVHTTAHVDLSTSECYTIGSTDYSGADGSLHTWWDNDSSHWTYTGTTIPHSGLMSIQAFGYTYTYASTTGFGDDYSDANAGGWTDNYTGPNGATLQVKSTLSYGGYYNSVAAWHPEWGRVTASSTTSAITSTLSGLSWNARLAPTFAGFVLWIDGKLATWQSGTLAADGLATDTYAGAGVTLTISAQVYAYFEDDENAVVTFTSSGTGSGSMAGTGAFAMQGHVIQKAGSPNRSAPFFTGDKTAIKVSISSIYNFSGGYEDSAGQRVDVYTNANGTLLMIGNVVDSSHATIKLTQSNTTKTGTFQQGFFDVTGVTVTTNITQPADAFGPPAVWVRGEFYTRISPAAAAYQSASSHTIALGGTASAPTVSGSDEHGSFSGSMPREPVGIFLLLDGTGGATVPAIAANADGSMHLGWTPPPAGFPPAVLVDNEVWEFFGVATDDTAPTVQAAYYGVPIAADTTIRLIKLRTDESGTVTCTSYADGTSSSGTYDAVSRLFQTSQPLNGFPVPTYAVNPLANNALWHHTPPSSLPPSLRVRGQPWWYAGTDENGISTYLGFYTGQSVTVGTLENGARLVTLIDPVHNAEAADPNQAAHGSLSDIRNGARLRDGTLVTTGSTSGEVVLTEVEDDYLLHTIASDLDVVGNNLSFGVFPDDASLSGALFQFSGTTTAATLHSILSKPQARWGWWKAGATESDPVEPVMWLDEAHKLRIYPSTSSSSPAIVLDPEGPSSFKKPVRIPAGGDIPMGPYQAGGAP